LCTLIYRTLDLLTATAVDQEKENMNRIVKKNVNDKSRPKNLELQDDVIKNDMRKKTKRPRSRRGGWKGMRGLSTVTI